MSEKKLASLFNGRFNKENKPYIRSDEKGIKIIQNLNFENFELNLQTSSIIICDNPRRIKIPLGSGESLLSSNTENTAILGKDLVGIVSDKSYPNNKVVFEDCDFDSLDIGVLTHEVIFKNCTIKTLNINNKNYDKVSKTLQINGGVIIECNINKSIITNKFYINKQYDDNCADIRIDKLIIKDTVFKENFKLHKCKVGKIEIEDVDFEKNADFFMSKFTQEALEENQEDKNIYFKAINFQGLAIFGDTEFNEKLIFKYITFEGFSHFRKAKFFKGLDLDYSNIQEEMNFFDAEELENDISKQNTSQETYRIIKHNFEKIGNKIEANKYHALELGQKRKKLEEENGDWKERLVFMLHDWSSEHSTNWLYPILWSLAIGILTVLFVNFGILVDLFFQPSLFKLEYLGKIWNEFWQYCYIGNMSDKLKDSPLIFLLNKVILGYLYYQFLMSVRKDTRK